jgi:hypothetical protein
LGYLIDEQATSSSKAEAGWGLMADTLAVAQRWVEEASVDVPVACVSVSRELVVRVRLSLLVSSFHNAVRLLLLLRALGCLLAHGKQRGEKRANQATTPCTHPREHTHHPHRLHTKGLSLFLSRAPRSEASDDGVRC